MLGSLWVVFEEGEVDFAVGSCLCEVWVFVESAGCGVFEDEEAVGGEYVGL